MTVQRGQPSAPRLRIILGVCLLGLTACGGAALTQAGPIDTTGPRPDPLAHRQVPAMTPVTLLATLFAPAATGVPRPTSRPTSTPRPAPGGPTLGGCPVFPADNPWNQDISRGPLDPSSTTYISRIDSFRQFVHPDFGSSPSYGIPYVVVPAQQPSVPITFAAYGDQSDPGPYPVPLSAPVEAGSDHHVLVADAGTCKLYEMYNAHQLGTGWTCDSGAVFNLRSDALRPDTWTSADAAGLSILPGLVRYDEVAAGVISHALRFTVDETQNGFIHPATHQAGVGNAADPPMGLRLRLKASFDLSPFRGEALVILTALKRYGMYVVDNGSSWFISGSTDSRWNDTDLDQLKTVPGSAFEVVATGPILRG